MTPSELSDIRIRLREKSRVSKNLYPGSSYLSWLSPKVGYSMGTLRQFRAGYYRGDNERIARAILEVWGEE